MNGLVGGPLALKTKVVVGSRCRCASRRCSRLMSSAGVVPARPVSLQSVSEWVTDGVTESTSLCVRRLAAAWQTDRRTDRRVASLARALMNLSSTTSHHRRSTLTVPSITLSHRYTVLDAHDNVYGGMRKFALRRPPQPYNWSSAKICTDDYTIISEMLIILPKFCPDRTVTGTSSKKIVKPFFSTEISS